MIDPSVRENMFKQMREQVETMLRSEKRFGFILLLVAICMGSVSYYTFAGDKFLSGASLSISLQAFINFMTSCLRIRRDLKDLKSGKFGMPPET